MYSSRQSFIAELFARNDDCTKYTFIISINYSSKLKFNIKKKKVQKTQIK